MTVTTVEANWILYRIMTYNKTARGKSKYIKKTPNPRTDNIFVKKLSCLATVLQTFKVSRKNTSIHIHQKKPIASFNTLF